MKNIHLFSSVKKFHPEEKNLSELLKSVKNSSLFPEERDDELISPSSFAKMQQKIEGDINKILLQRDYINSDYFLCGNYIAKMITETVQRPPKSWYTIDYLSQINSEEGYIPLKEAGDICFLISSVFTKRANHGLMKPSYYTLMGKNFYYLYYEKGKKEIGYLMSRRYKTMSQITREVTRPLFQ